MFGMADFSLSKQKGRPIVMATAYDAWGAALVAEGGIDAILVGDSAAMVVHGHPTTLHATMDMMETHVGAVRRGAPTAFVVADMPFMSTRTGLADAVRNAGALMRAGANAVKIEGIGGHEELIPHLVASGIPVMGHLGLQPQQVEVLGAFRVQGKDEAMARRIIDDARQAQDLGCFSLVLECVPNDLAASISGELAIPTIGIGAGVDTDGQILVFHDLLGLGRQRLPRFVRPFARLADPMAEAFAAYAASVRDRTFPRPEETYGDRTAPGSGKGAEATTGPEATLGEAAPYGRAGSPMESPTGGAS